MDVVHRAEEPQAHGEESTGMIPGVAWVDSPQGSSPRSNPRPVSASSLASIHSSAPLLPVLDTAPHRPSNPLLPSRKRSLSRAPSIVSDVPPPFFAPLPPTPEVGKYVLRVLAVIVAFDVVWLCATVTLAVLDDLHPEDTALHSIFSLASVIVMACSTQTAKPRHWEMSLSCGLLALSAVGYQVANTRPGSVVTIIYVAYVGLVGVVHLATLAPLKRGFPATSPGPATSTTNLRRCAPAAYEPQEHDDCIYFLSLSDTLCLEGFEGAKGIGPDGERITGAIKAFHTQVVAPVSTHLPCPSAGKATGTLLQIAGLIPAKGLPASSRPASILLGELGRVVPVHKVLPGYAPIVLPDQPPEGRVTVSGAAMEAGEERYPWGKGQFTIDPHDVTSVIASTCVISTTELPACFYSQLLSITAAHPAYFVLHLDTPLCNFRTVDAPTTMSLSSAFTSRTNSMSTSMSIAESIDEMVKGEWRTAQGHIVRISEVRRSSSGCIIVMGGFKVAVCTPQRITLMNGDIWLRADEQFAQIEEERLTREYTRQCEQVMSSERRVHAAEGDLAVLLRKVRSNPAPWGFKDLHHVDHILSHSLRELASLVGVMHRGYIMVSGTNGDYNQIENCRSDHRVTIVSMQGVDLDSPVERRRYLALEGGEMVLKSRDDLRRRIEVSYRLALIACMDVGVRHVSVEPVTYRKLYHTSLSAETIRQLLLVDLEAQLRVLAERNWHIQYYLVRVEPEHLQGAREMMESLLQHNAALSSPAKGRYLRCAVSIHRKDPKLLASNMAAAALQAALIIPCAAPCPMLGMVGGAFDVAMGSRFGIEEDVGCTSTLPLSRIDISQSLFVDPSNITNLIVDHFVLPGEASCNPTQKEAADEAHEAVQIVVQSATVPSRCFAVPIPAIGFLLAMLSVALSIHIWRPFNDFLRGPPGQSAVFSRGDWGIGTYVRIASSLLASTMFAIGTLTGDDNKSAAYMVWSAGVVCLAALSVDLAVERAYDKEGGYIVLAADAACLIAAGAGGYVLRSRYSPERVPPPLSPLVVRPPPLNFAPAQHLPPIDPPVSEPEALECELCGKCREEEGLCFFCMVLAHTVVAALDVVLMASYPAACPYAGLPATVESFTWEVLRVHPKHECEHPVSCPWGCGMILRVTQLGTHQSDCVRGDWECDLCGKVLSYLKRSTHHEVCAAATVTCPLGCPAEVTRQKLADHLLTCKNRTDGRCEWCGETVGEEEAKRAAHDVVCGSYRVPCPLGTSCPPVERAKLLSHILEMCPQRKLPCPLGCGAVLDPPAVLDHTSDLCPKRRIQCPRHDDGCLVEVLAGNLDDHVDKYCVVGMKCPFGCSATVNETTLVPHIFDTCPSLLAPGSPDLEDSLLHCPLCSVSLDSSIEDRRDRLSEHYPERCSHARVPCPAGCANYVVRKDLHVHTATSCTTRVSTCRGCGSHGINSSHDNSCPYRILACPFCDTPKPLNVLADHVKLGCPKRTHKCRWCSAVVSLEKYGEHGAECRGKCPLCGVGGNVADHFESHRWTCRRCEEVVWHPTPELVQAHQRDCTAREVLCSNGCHTVVAVCEQGKHNAVCQRFPIACPLGCGVREPKDVHHCCPWEHVWCDLCGKVMRQGALLWHMKEVHADYKGKCVFGCSSMFSPSHAAVCSLALLPCPLRCGELVPRSNIIPHMHTSCRSRMVVCEKCGDVHPAGLGVHMCCAEPLPCLGGCGERVLGTEHTCSGLLAMCPSCSKVLPITDSHPCAMWKATSPALPPLTPPNPVPLLPCPIPNCGLSFRSSGELRKHLVAICPHQPVACEQCGDFVHPSQTTSHTCNQPAGLDDGVDPAACPHGCGERVPPAHHQLHRSTCPSLLVVCPLCDTCIPRADYAPHCTSACPMRRVACPWCESMFAARDVAAHSVSCPRRVASCSVGCGIRGVGCDHCCYYGTAPCPMACGADVARYALADHVAVCLRALESAEVPYLLCPMMCGERIAFPDIARHFVSCAEVPVACPDGCREHVRRADLASHSTTWCRNRKVACPFGCGDEIPFASLTEHRERCERAPLLCPYPGCSGEVSRGTLPSHAVVCEYRPAPCQQPTCGALVPLAHLAEHGAVCKTEPREPCPNACGVHSCSSAIPGPFHLRCPLQRVPCALGCPDTVLIRDMNKHVTNTCPYRLAPCRFCSLPVPSHVLDTHAVECWRREVGCPAGCGDTIECEHIPAHAQHCAKRHLPCPYSCGVRIAIQDKEKHITQECPNRLQPCMHCGKAYPMSAQHQSGCPSRVVHCKRCQRKMKAAQLEKHTASECPERLSSCKYCRVELPAHRMDGHESSCSLRDTCPMCDEPVPVGGLEQHARETCPHRLVQCHECHASIAARDMDSHSEHCDFAKRRCEHCERFFAQCRIKSHEGRCRLLERNYRMSETIRPFIGLDVTDYACHPAQSIAALITKVVPRSAAAAASLREHDIIVSINDSDVRGRSEAVAVLSAVSCGEQVRFKLLPSHAVGAKQGRRGVHPTQITDANNVREEILDRARTDLREVVVTVGGLPNLDPETLFCCRSKITVLTYNYLRQTFNRVARGDRLASYELVAWCTQLGVQIPRDQLNSLAVSSEGMCLADLVLWLREHGHLEELEHKVWDAPEGALRVTPLPSPHNAQALA